MTEEGKFFFQMLTIPFLTCCFTVMFFLGFSVCKITSTYTLCKKGDNYNNTQAENQTYQIEKLPLISIENKGKECQNTYTGNERK